MSTDESWFRKGAVRNALCIALCSALYATVPVVYAQSTTPSGSIRRYDIAAGSLSSAINAWGAQSGKQVVFAPGAVAGKQTRGATGQYSAEQALTQLLAGTGLVWKHVNGQTYALEQAPPQHANANQGQAPTPQTSSSASIPKPTTLSAINVVGAASHIDFPNIVSVTPTVTFTPEELQLRTQTNVGNALYALPQVVADRGPQATGTNTDASGSPVDLRGLGVNRTLVLVDGHRLVHNNDGGGNDLNAIPSMLIQNVQIVTGGASAAWGSGAVAGVVSIIMNHNFNGLEFDTNYGQSSHSDDKTRVFRLAMGHGFADGRGHIELGGDFARSGGVLVSTRPNAFRWSILPTESNPNLTANTPNVGVSNQTYGGLILSGVLQGMKFGPGGSISPNVLERTVGAAAVGNPANAPGASDLGYLIDPVKHYTVMGDVDYNLSDNVKASLTVDHYESTGNFPWFSLGLPTLTINQNNAFLPASVVAAMRNAGEQSFQFGRFDEDFGYPRLITSSRTNQETAKVQGVTSSDWHWSLFYTHGSNTLNQSAPGFAITNNLLNAVDAVVNPTTGQVVCQIALVDPTSNCVPVDLFGEGAPSQAAANYVKGTAMEHVTRTLDQAGFDISGQPVELPAGFLSVAAGVGGWRQAVNQEVGPLDQEQALSTFFYNPMRGSQSVVDVYGEVNVPLVADGPGLHDFSMDAAIRGSHYDTSGSVKTWKIGLTDRIIGHLRARVALSHDERAPDLAEMFTVGTQGFDTLFDPVLNTSYNILINSGGNPHLAPEQSHTFTGGLTWAGGDGVAMSADYYNIKINQIITTIDPQLIINLCQSGQASLCDIITRGGPENHIQVIEDNFINLSKFGQDGVDLEASKVTQGHLFGVGGQYSIRFNGTWVHKLTENNGASTLNFVGSQGQAFVDEGVPRWRGLLTGAFTNQRFDIHARIRYLSAGYYDTNQPTLVNNRIPQYMYVDLGGSYTVPGTTLTFYGEMQNVGDKKPPIASEYGSYYDVIGRFTQIGFRIKFPNKR